MEERSVLVLLETVSVLVGKAGQQEHVVIADFACALGKKRGVQGLSLLSPSLFWGPWSTEWCHLHSGWVFLSHLNITILRDASPW